MKFGELKFGEMKGHPRTTWIAWDIGLTAVRIGHSANLEGATQ